MYSVFNFSFTVNNSNHYFAFIAHSEYNLIVTFIELNFLSSNNLGEVSHALLPSQSLNNHKSV